MPSKYPKPSREWRPYSGSLQFPSCSRTEFARVIEMARNKCMRDEACQRLGTKDQTIKIRRTALLLVAALKKDALLAHFGIEPGAKSEWQQLALYLAAHHVPGCMLIAPGAKDHPKYDSYTVLEVYLKAKHLKRNLKSNGNSRKNSEERAMSMVQREYHKVWPELNDMKYSSLKRRYYEAYNSILNRRTITQGTPPIVG